MTMTSRTTADENLNKATKNLRTAAKVLAGVVVEECGGCDEEGSKQRRKEIKVVLNQTLDSIERLNHPGDDQEVKIGFR